MKAVLFVILLLTASVMTSAQQASIKSDAKVPAPTLIKLPPDRIARLKELQTQQDRLSEAFQALEREKTIVALQAAVDLQISRSQLDQMEVALDGDGYVFRPKASQVPPKKAN